MNWRNKRWPEGYFSVATLEFEEREDDTLLKLTQTGVPANFYENTEDGWRNFYWNAIRQKFGFGSKIF
jgi:activator of HSP90 ATPase